MNVLPQIEDPPCECKGPGFCCRYKIEQTEYAWRVCSEQCTDEFPCTAETSRRYRAKWAKKKVGMQHPTIRKHIIAKSKANTNRPKQPPRKPPKPKLHCIHLGQATGEQKECKSCNKTLSYHSVYNCALHGNCTITRSFEPLACCKTCGNYEAKEIVNGQ